MRNNVRLNARTFFRGRDDQFFWPTREKCVSLRVFFGRILGARPFSRFAKKYFPQECFARQKHLASSKKKKLHGLPCKKKNDEGFFDEIFLRGLQRLARRLKHSVEVGIFKSVLNKR